MGASSGILPIASAISNSVAYEPTTNTKLNVFR